MTKAQINLNFLLNEDKEDKDNKEAIKYDKNPRKARKDAVNVAKDRAKEHVDVIKTDAKIAKTFKKEGTPEAAKILGKHSKDSKTELHMFNKLYKDLLKKKK